MAARHAQGSSGARRLDEGPGAETKFRRWFGHDPARWGGFRQRYEAELARHRDLLDEIRDRARQRTMTLLFAARDEAHNEAVVLKDVLLKRAN
ncbi:MAG TPA: DUF488 family protein [Stellaceae bacterium]|nr:DUF488 family protein [Stellaceae bacterium]